MESSSSSSGWAPHVALQMVEEERAKTWRRHNNLEDEGGFAFYFVDYDQALTHAGRAVAHSWLEARHSSIGGMLQQVERTIRDALSSPSKKYRNSSMWTILA